MATTLPIIEQLRAAVVARMEALKPSAYTAEYKVYEDRKVLQHPHDGMCVVAHLNPTPNKARTSQAKDEYDVVFQIGFIVQERSDFSRAIDDRLNMAEADIQKTLLAEPTSFNGLAWDLELQQSMPIDFGDENPATRGKEIRVQISFRTDKNNPFSL